MVADSTNDVVSGPHPLYDTLFTWGSNIVNRNRGPAMAEEDGQREAVFNMLGRRGLGLALFRGYFSDMYLSTEIIVRWMMVDEVNKTSRPYHVTHSSLGMRRSSMSACTMETGMTRMADNMSLMARDTRKKLNMLRNFLSSLTARITSKLPTMAATTIQKKQSTGQFISGFSCSLLDVMLYVTDHVVSSAVPFSMLHTDREHGTIH